MSRSRLALVVFLVALTALAGIVGVGVLVESRASGPAEAGATGTSVDPEPVTASSTVGDATPTGPSATPPASTSDVSAPVDPVLDAPPVTSGATTAPDVTTAPTAPAVSTEPPPSLAPDCRIPDTELVEGDTGFGVLCLETQLVEVGALTGVTPDETFDVRTDAAVRTFQTDHGLKVDGIVGAATASRLAGWAGRDTSPPDPATCPPTGHAAVVDRTFQRAWLCDAGAVAHQMPMTSAISQPDPGVYEVYAKDMDSASDLTGRLSTMTHFVAFTYGKYQGARIAFHSVPTYGDGEYVQPLDSVGDPDRHGESSGCIRVLPDDAVLIWDWLAVGDPVVVVS